MIVGYYLILFRVLKTGGFTYILNTVGVILLVLPIITITSFNIANRTPTQTQFLPASPENFQPVVPQANLPDIYYFIPDGYARADVLDDLYGLNNSDFIGYLTTKGFT